jgi:glycerate 2-kinase
MSTPSVPLHDHARAIWQAAVDAVNPLELVRSLLRQPPEDLARALAGPGQVLVVGGGKAGAPMVAGALDALADRLDRVRGVVNVPEGASPGVTGPVRLHPARPAGTNHPTEQGVVGTTAILELARHAGPDDVVLCLLSGGGSALLPAPVEGITLADKQAVTALLHECGATIDEMNCVRKHLSRIKGGRLAEAFLGERRSVFSLIISDVVGDPLDVIASGPTAPDPTTFADALAVLDSHGLASRVPPAVLAYLKRGRAGDIPDTPKALPDQVYNLILGNNRRALDAARLCAEERGFRVADLGSFIEGETRQVATALAGVARSIRADGLPVAPPAVLLCGGETTVTLPPGHGKGGRNQEFVLAALCKLGKDGMRNLIVLSGGTDGEDGPTDAAGAWAGEAEVETAHRLGLDPASYLQRHDSYAFFEATGSLLRTGLTHTNVMDVRLFLIGS